MDLLTFGRTRLRTAAAVAFAGAAVAGFAAWAVLAHPFRDDSANEYLDAHRLRAVDYATVPLPTTPPPAGAVVSVTSNGDPIANGQGVSFQYSGFTVRACTYRLDRAERDACTPQQDMTIFRQIDDVTFRTLYSISTKNGAAVPVEGRAAEQFFKSADVARTPSWLEEYATDKIKELTE